MIDNMRLRNPKLFEKIISAEEAAELITDGMNVGTSGFTPAGYPKAVPLALAKAVENGRKTKISLWTGASVGPELENELARVGAIARRAPMIRNSNRHISNGVNNGDISYTDIHLSHMGQQVDYGFLGPVNVAIIEATAITSEGHIIPTTSVGNSHIYAKNADKIIVEINTSQPLELEGMHDIYDVGKPPFRREIPIYNTVDRIGKPYIEVGLDRIAAIVESNIPDPESNLSENSEKSLKIAGYLIDFLSNEIKTGRIPASLLPFQSGVGNINNAVLYGLLNSKFERMQFFSEMIQPAVFDLIDAGKVEFASCTCFTPDKSVLDRLMRDPERYKKAIVMRNVDICNNPELIRRLGVIALNTPLEVDIYGHANSTHIMGTRMMNAIGGSGDYMRNSFLSIFTSEATAKNDTISKIVPMVSHVDSTEHDWHVFITEYGVADLRGLSPRERAKSIINNCSHPKYREHLKDYFKDACKLGGHSPHNLSKALSWQIKYLETGTML